MAIGEQQGRSRFSRECFATEVASVVQHDAQETLRSLNELIVMNHIDKRQGMQKQVFMICYYFTPDISVASLRSRKFAQYLDKFEWECEVLTATKGNSAAHALPESVHVTRVRSPNFIAWLDAFVRWFSCITRKARPAKNATPHSPDPCAQAPKKVGGLGIATKIQRWLLLPDQQFLWILAAALVALRKQRTCAVIYSSAWPVSAHVVALLIHALTKKPWVADYRDEWTLNSQWHPPTRFHRWFGETLDRACVKNATFIVNVTETRTENFKRKYPTHTSKFVTIHNGYDEADVARFRHKKLASEYMLCTSLGSIYGGRSPNVFLKALQELVEEREISRTRLRVLLFNNQHINIAATISQHHLDDVVKALPRASQHEAFDRLAESHVALLFGSDMEKVAMTTKVYEYAGMGKTIFALVPDGPVKDFVMQCSGMIAAPDNKEQIKCALRNLFAKYSAGAITHLPVSETAAQYERSALTRQLAELLNRADVTNSRCRTSR